MSELKHYRTALRTQGQLWGRGYTERYTELTTLHCQLD